MPIFVVNTIAQSTGDHSITELIVAAGLQNLTITVDPIVQPQGTAGLCNRADVSCGLAALIG